jgi:6-phosphofructokinase
MAGNAIVGQAGGPTRVINRSLSGLVDYLLFSDSGFNGKLFGAIHGSEGMKIWDVMDLADTSINWPEVRRTPGDYLGGTRDKPDESYCEEIFRHFKKHDIRYFFYIGGNDSANTAHIIQKVAADSNYDLFAFHMHKTVDNDLVKGDHMPGFPSAAKYIVYSIAGVICDAASIPGIVIIECMGRDAGFLTASGALVNEVLKEGLIR